MSTTYPAIFNAIVIAIAMSLSCVCSAHRVCSSRTSSSPCPPFDSPPPYPFSPSPGCGHPSFQVRCSVPHSVLVINGLRFAILRYETNSSSLLLSPHPETKYCNSSNFHFIPGQPVNLSGSPFRVSDASCSRLSVLKPCSNSNLSNCHCQWDCKLMNNPINLLHGCGSNHGNLSDQGCQSDVLGFLDNFMKLGMELEWDEGGEGGSEDTYFSSCRDCQAKFGICGFNSAHPDKPFICFGSKSQFPVPWLHKNISSRILFLSSILGLTGVILIALITIAVLRSRRLESSSFEEDPTTMFLHLHRSASLLPPVFTYEELEAATNRFDLKRKIGDGGFGSVFLGQLYDGGIVAVKYLHVNHQAAAAGRAFNTKSFCNEILILSSIDHPNLVKLHGYCSDPRGLLLVYDYIPNGTLADHLHGPKSLYKKGSLTWQVRINIALQTAIAMEYLHFAVQPAIVHRDITSTNIFVEKDMRIKVGDFGLSRLLIFPERTTTSTSSSNCVWTGPQGTPGYLDPDYHRSFRLTEKSDVYSFGVVLLELISGLKAVDQKRDKREMTLADMVVSKIQMGLLYQVIDPVMALDGKTTDGVDAAAELAFRCVAADKDDRPDSREVVEELRRICSCTGVLRGGNSNPNLNVVADVDKG